MLGLTNGMGLVQFNLLGLGSGPLFGSAQWAYKVGLQHVPGLRSRLLWAKPHVQAHLWENPRI